MKLYYRILQERAPHTAKVSGARRLAGVIIAYFNGKNRSNYPSYGVIRLSKSYLLVHCEASALKQAASLSA